MVRSETVSTPKNSRTRPVTQLCFTLEKSRRDGEGRVRDAKGFLAHFFPNGGAAVDRLFLHLPNEVRADLLSNWGIRGKKSALRDDDERVRMTVCDALAAGDIDAAVVEEGVTPEILIDWVPLEDWWTFWRGNALPVTAVRKALGVARDLALFDDRWFFDHLSMPHMKLKGTDVVCSALSKDQIVHWIHAVHASGDASPAGLVAALGWDTVATKTAHDALLLVLDRLAGEVGLANAPEPPVSSREAPVSSREPPASSREPPASSREPPASSKEVPVTLKEVPPLVSEPRPAPSTNSTQPLPIAQKTKTAPMPAVTSPLATTGGFGTKSTTQPLVARPMPDAAVAPSHVPAPAPLPPPAVAPAPAVISSPPRPALIEPAPVSGPPTARALFGSPALPPMRAPMATLSGIGSSPPDPPIFASGPIEITPSVPSQPRTTKLADPPWAPPRAEPADMGWDLLYGVKRSMSTNVTPKYNFGDDDEPTSEIALETGRG
jgi:hypothetical protein